MNKPFQSYNGGKESDGSYQKIISIMPPHDIYIEAFLGNGAIYRKKKPAFVSSIGIDLDTAVINEWSKIAPKDLTLINTDAISWLEHFKVTDDILKKIGVSCLIYLDPPYPRSCKKGLNDLYKYVMNDNEHIRLLDVVDRINAKIVISSYPNKIYDTVLKDWNSFTFQAQTRQGAATEKVWYNFDRPSELHDYRYIGNDYRQRERLKGIISRGVAKFKRMPDQERNALIHELKNHQLI